MVSFNIIAASNIDRYNRPLDDDSLNNYTVAHYVSNNNNDDSNNSRDIINNVLNIRTDEVHAFDPQSSLIIEPNHNSKYKMLIQILIRAIRLTIFTCFHFHRTIKMPLWKLPTIDMHNKWLMHHIHRSPWRQAYLHIWVRIAHHTQIFSCTLSSDTTCK